MLESTPGAPYVATLEDCLRVEPNMRYRSVLLHAHDWQWRLHIDNIWGIIIGIGRRELIKAQLADNETLVTLTSFPRLGASGIFTVPRATPCGPVAQSLYLPDEIINQHIRFPLALWFPSIFILPFRNFNRSSSNPAFIALEPWLVILESAVNQK
jgi:glutamate--cysteine ligase catalytic subunit